VNPLKRLASQTAVYGLSSIIGRFLNYLLVPLYTYTFVPADYGVVAEFYAYMGFLAVLLTFGMETGYFRFRSGASDPSHRGGDGAAVPDPRQRRLSARRGGLAAAHRGPAAPRRPSGVHLVGGGDPRMDSVGNAAFARLRAEDKALRFAGIKLIEIGANIGLNLFFIVLCRQAFEADPGSFLGRLWDPAIGVGYVFLANLAASGLKLVLLTPQFRGALTGLRRRAVPAHAALLAADGGHRHGRHRQRDARPRRAQVPAALRRRDQHGAARHLQRLLQAVDPDDAVHPGLPLRRRALLLQLRQAERRQADLRAGAELVRDLLRVHLPAGHAVYRPVPVLRRRAYREGLGVVPVLLLANLLLGVYVNLSIWYKLTDRTLLGAWVALIGAGITIGMLWLLVPTYGYQGAAWAHLICYSAMVAMSYCLGRRYYPVPYEWSACSATSLLGLALFGAGRWLTDDRGLERLRRRHAADAGLSGGGRPPGWTHAGRTPRRQATMRPTAAASTRAPRSTWRPKLRHLDLTLALAAASMAVVSIAFNDAAKAPIYLLLAYLLWRIGRRG
jgi:hypothetical protein